MRYLPFNKDSFIGPRIQQLCTQYEIKTIIETGTSTGESTVAFRAMTNNVITIELSPDKFVCNADFDNVAGIKRYLGHSEQLLPNLVVEAAKPILFYLDAHSNTESPILQEINSLKYCGPGTPVVLVIHDFYVPESKLQFSIFNGKRFDIEYIQPALEQVMKITKISYNDDAHADGCKVGVVYVEGAVL